MDLFESDTTTYTNDTLNQFIGLPKIQLIALSGDPLYKLLGIMTKINNCYRMSNQVNPIEICPPLTLLQTQKLLNNGYIVAQKPNFEPNENSVYTPLGYKLFYQDQEIKFEDFPDNAWEKFKYPIVNILFSRILPLDNSIKNIIYYYHMPHDLSFYYHVQNHGFVLVLFSNGSVKWVQKNTIPSSYIEILDEYNILDNIKWPIYKKI